MTPKQVYEYYGSSYKFRKETGMSAMSLSHWLKWGFVPDKSQIKLHRLTNGKLKAEIKGVTE